jgi:selenocysteine lyase/cysteine desulfurase
LQGVNTVLRNLTYKPDDVLIAYSTSYGSVLQTLRYLCDANPGVTLEVIPLEFPECTHEEILRRTEEVVKKYNKKRGEEGEGGGRVKMVMIDGMSSMPGVVMPWRGLAALARDYGALSVVDGAHLVGSSLFSFRPTLSASSFLQRSIG